MKAPRHKMRLTLNRSAKFDAMDSSAEGVSPATLQSSRSRISSEPRKMVVNVKQKFSKGNIKQLSKKVQ